MRIYQPKIRDIDSKPSPCEASCQLEQVQSCADNLTTCEAWKAYLISGRILKPRIGIGITPMGTEYRHGKQAQDSTQHIPCDEVLKVRLQHLGYEETEVME